ncbi:hypothetical protein DC083_07875 [Ignatzschineria ureiclastica]|uniref:Uncharacterized protein n=1 Tax=Ignatzschineria ureiclastica TaxID=472582 RepID=A0A2U2AEF6_9GAMM|nr:hypothetical protein [Ignatzschineria ureiclastica]PWD81007.1 hypothetical protein DC083_07875 [Ignatzschineria ureiclastica]
MIAERLSIAHLWARGLSGFASILSRRENDRALATVLRRQVGQFLNAERYFYFSKLLGLF